MTKTTKGVRRPTREQLAERQREREARYTEMQKAHPAIAQSVKTPAVAKAAKAAKAAKPKSDRNVAPRPASFSLLTRGVEHRDLKMDAMALNYKLGSRDLCKAILATKRTHGPMTEAEQIEAVKYAYNLM